MPTGQPIPYEGKCLDGMSHTLNCNDEPCLHFSLREGQNLPERVPGRVFFFGPKKSLLRNSPPRQIFFLKSPRPINFFSEKVSAPSIFFSEKVPAPSICFSEKVSTPPPTLCPVPVLVNFGPSLRKYMCWQSVKKGPAIGASRPCVLVN